MEGTLTMEKKPQIASMALMVETETVVTTAHTVKMELTEAMAITAQMAKMEQMEKRGETAQMAATA